jgi:hypothetical protein
MAVLIRDRATNQFEDRTLDVSEIRTAGQRVEIVFINSNKPFEYGRDRVRILRNPKRYALTEGERVEVDGNAWESARWIREFTPASPPKPQVDPRIHPRFRGSIRAST